MAERFKFSVDYEPATMRSAVRSYVLRTLTIGNAWVPTAATFVIVVGAGFWLFASDFGFQAGLFAGVLAALIAGATTLGWAHWRASKAKLASVKEPRATFALYDEVVEVSTDSGSSRLAWERVRQIWKFKRVWLLMLDLNQFVTLPLAGAPAEALVFLDQKVQPRPFRTAR